MKLGKVLISAALLVSGCGGGGEGGSRQIEFSSNTLSFKGVQGQEIPSQTISVNVDLGTSQRYVGVDNKSPNLARVTYKVTHIDAFSITVTPVSGLAKGVYTGTFDALVCDDKNCDKVNDRGTYSYTISIS